MDGKMKTAAAVLLTLLPLAARGALVTRIAAVREEARAAAYAPAADRGAAESDPCLVADETLYALESAIMETEARLWAYRMRQPNFSRRNPLLPPDPGITHPELQDRFQERLAFWRSREFISRPSADALARAKEISKNIRLVKAMRGHGGTLKCSERRGS